MKYVNHFIGSARKSFGLVFLFLGMAGLLGASPASAQTITTGRITHTIVKSKVTPPSMGREFWVALAQNYLDESGKYYRIYITSANNTTAYVQMGNGPVTAVPVGAYKIGTANIPLGWEMKSSGVVENKGVHIWSNDADICCYLMSHNPYTSDGEYIIPNIGWGTDYVVAAYGALFEGFGSYVFDFPSEFTIVANQDNTVCTITPSADLRQAAAYPGNNTVVAYPAGVPFTVQLNRGQSVQYQTVKAQGVDGYDVTGTIIHSNQPVGVVGGSQCPNIPPDFPYCDHVTDMIPPVRTWAQTYYTTSPAQPMGMSGHDFSLYLIISSKPGQMIYRQDATTGIHQECIINNKYGTYWVEEQLSNKWFSDAPFLLVQYLNSSTYPDYNNGNGDPAEVVVNPRENFTKTVVFQTPVSIGSQTPYDNYANIIVNVNDERNTLFDGGSILKYTHQPVDDTFEVFVVPHIAPGAHVVKGDTSGVGVYIYGYGFDESYAWTGSFGTGTFHSPDTVPPLPVITGECYRALVHLSDSGNLPGITPPQPQSHLNAIHVDTIYNMAYQPDPYPNWIEGAGLDTSGYSMFVADRTKPAILVVETIDLAGNVTTITSTYTPQVAGIAPPLQDFGVGKLTPTYEYDTLINQGKIPFKFTNVSLLHGDVGFKIDSAATGPLAVGEKRIIKISFLPVKQTTVHDTIIFGDECLVDSAAVVGSGGAPDFWVADVIWKDVPLTPPSPGAWVEKAAAIHNTSKQDVLHINSPSWTDSTHFVLIPGQTFPRVVQPLGVDSVQFWYEPTDLNGNTAVGTWTAQENGTDGNPLSHTDKLIGNAIAPSAAFGGNDTISLACITTPDTAHFAFVLSNVGKASLTVRPIIMSNTTDFINLVGHDMHRGSWDASRQTETLLEGDYDTILVDFPVTPNTNQTATTTLIAIDANTGDTIGRATATVNVVYRSQQILPTSLTFGAPTPIDFRGAPQSATFNVTNSASEDLTITSIALENGGAYNGAYTITAKDQANQPITYPYVAKAGVSVQVTVNFDPSAYPDSAQAANVLVNTDACVQQKVPLMAYVVVSGAAAIGHTFPPMLSCDQGSDFITVLNTKPVGFVDTIVSASWVQNTGKFTTPNVIHDIVDGNASLKFPVNFNPDPNAAAQTVYDTLELIMHNNHMLKNGTYYDTVFAPVKGTAAPIMLTATSDFGTAGVDSAYAGQQLTLPIHFSVNLNGLDASGYTLANENITKVVLKYYIPHPDLLSVPTASDISGLPNGWSVSNPQMVGDTLIVTLTGTQPLDEKVTSLGQIRFNVYLSKSDGSTQVQLVSITPYTNAGNTLGSCVQTSVQSGTMNLILRCGDATMRAVMSNQPFSFVRPVTPNPVTGGHITFDYQNRGAMNLTLAIYDVLGKEVSRPIDNIRHDAGEWMTTVDVSNMPNGTYTYRMSSGKDVISQQFVIQR